MSLEVKLGDLEMGLFGRKKKNKDEHSEDGMTRREFLKFGKNAGIAAAGAYLGANVFGGSEALAGGNPAKIPGAIMADPDKKLVDVWWDIKGSKYFDHPYSCDNIEMAKRVMRIHNGISYNGVVEVFTPKTSHAYYLISAKINYIPIGRIPESNHSLIQFANGLQQFFKSGWSNDSPDYRMASWKFAEGMFLAAMPGQNKEAIGKANEFMTSDVRGKEMMLRNVYENNFKNVKANPKVTDINTMEYKMLSLYWNLGFFILADYNRGNKDEALELRNTKGNVYQTIFKKYDFDTANGKLL